jgi:hypothetical protein
LAVDVGGEGISGGTKSMTQYRCWIGYESDRALQSKIKQGFFSDEGELHLPLNGFPAPSNDVCWPGTLREWCKERGIPVVVEGLTVSTKVKKPQIEDFIEYVYGSDPSYSDPAKMLTWKGRAYLANSLTNLRAFVAQQLSPRLRYELRADEF